MRFVLLPCFGAVLVLFCCAQSLAAHQCAGNAVRVVPKVGPPVCVTVHRKRIEGLR